MYILTQENGGNIFYIFEDRQYTVGRKSADLILLNDQSISRKHAVITLTRGVLCLQDCGSKYGTCLQERKLTPEKQTVLEHNQVIKFGVFQSTFTVIKMNVITTSSALSTSDKVNLKKALSSFGGTVLDDWSSECTYLTANEIMLTVKLLLAVIDAKPVVTLEFWNKFSASIKNRESLPKAEDYKPPLAETFLTTNASFEPDKRRNILFRNKTFVFPTKRLLSKMEELIKRAGGSAFSWDQQQVTFDKVTANFNKYIFIIDSHKPVLGSLRDIHEKLAKIGQRTVPLQEIVIAVLMISMEKDCNPNVNRLGHIFNEESKSDLVSQVFPLAAATQSQIFESSSSLKQEIVISSSFDEESTLMTPKRLQNEAPSSAPPAKKIKQEPMSDSKKRKGDDSFLQAPAAKKPSLQTNPFAVIKSKTVKSKECKEDNPFAKLRIKSEKRIENNPFMMQRALEKKEENVNDEVDLISQHSNVSESHYLTPLSQNTNSTYGNFGRWLSKSTIQDEDLVEVDQEFKEIFAKFKNTVVIEPMPLNMIRPAQHYIIDPSTGRKNFKKFKKVQPLRPQTRILATSFYCGGEIVPKEEQEDKEEQEEDIQKPLFNRSRGKSDGNNLSRFVF